MKILIIEDEYALVDVIKERLIKENYFVKICTDGEEGYYEALNNYDLIILDVMLPNMNGFDILTNLRKNNIDSKIIMLTAKSMIEDKLNGLENGANDYITKPFHIDELVARVNIQLNFTKNNNEIIYGDIKLNIKNSKLTCIKTNESVELICKELELLEYFLKNPEQILSKEQLYDKVWGAESEVWSNNLEAYLSFIRKKLKAIGSSINIKSVRGLGYKVVK